MLIVSRLVERIVRLSTQPPFAWIPVDATDYLSRHGQGHIVKKFVSRWLPLAVTGQLNRRLNQIPAGSRVLWIHNGKPNLGDSLLELSGRRFLKGAPFTVDLWTLPHLAELFGVDEYLNAVYTDPGQIKFESYDAVLLTELNHRSIREKVRYARRLPWASLFGYFWGPDRNQALFSAAAVNQVFGLNLSTERLVNQAGPVVSLAQRGAAPPSTNIDVCLAVGGIDPKRTYCYWLKVLQHLDRQLEQAGWVAKSGHPYQITLVGSSNGLDQQRLIQATPFKCLHIESMVGVASLMQTAARIQSSQLFIGCDGGLLHLAHAVNAPSVALFADEKPGLRLTSRCHSTALQADGPVGLLDPSQVSASIFQAMNVVHQGLK